MYTKCQQCLKQSEWGSSLTFAKIVKDKKIQVVKSIIYMIAAVCQIF